MCPQLEYSVRRVAREDAPAILAHVVAALEPLSRLRGATGTVRDFFGTELIDYVKRL